MTDSASFGKTSALLVGGTALAVLGYNLWAYCCGRCSIHHFFDLGVTGYGLIGLNAIALGVLLVLRQRREQGRSSCPCVQSRRGEWRFCPDCGRPFDSPPD